MPTPGSQPLFTLHWLSATPPPTPSKMDTNKDFLAALYGAAVDRGDRSYNPALDFFAWQNSYWRMQDVYFFVVDVHGDPDPDKAVAWLKSRGYPDQENLQGYVYTFVFDDGNQHVLSCLKPIEQLAHVAFGNARWVIAERWALNLSRVTEFHGLYGSLDVIAKQWGGAAS